MNTFRAIYTRSNDWPRVEYVELIEAEHGADVNGIFYSRAAWTPLEYFVRAEETISQ